MTFFQAIILGLLQGVTELFPISSLGHSVLLTSLFGWHNLTTAQAGGESSFLAFLVMMHLATALALLVYYRREWVKIIKGFFSSLKNRSAKQSNEKLAWLLIIATIPAGLTGIIFEHVLRTQFAKPIAASVFLIINGFILLAGQSAQKKASQTKSDSSLETTTTNLGQKISFGRALIVGVAQVGALMAGISRSGITMVGGLFSGLDYQDSARFSFFLATPIILAAGIYKLPDFFGPLADGVRGQILAGSVVAAIAAYFSIRFLDKYFQNKSLKPFAYYCLAFGSLMLIINLSK